MRRIIIPHPLIIVLTSFGETQVSPKHCHCTNLFSPFSSSWGHQSKRKQKHCRHSFFTWYLPSLQWFSEHFLNLKWSLHWVASRDSSSEHLISLPLKSCNAKMGGIYSSCLLPLKKKVISNTLCRHMSCLSRLFWVLPLNWQYLYAPDHSALERKIKPQVSSAGPKTPKPPEQKIITP